MQNSPVQIILCNLSSGIYTRDIIEISPVCVHAHKETDKPGNAGHKYHIFTPNLYLNLE